MRGRNREHKKKSPAAYQSSTYATQIQKIKPTSKSKQEDSVISEGHGNIPELNELKESDMKSLVAKLTGVGHLIIPKDIKFQKWMISSILAVFFALSCVGNGVVIYGIEKALGDKCYSPFNKIITIPEGGYFCPSFADGFIKADYAFYLHLFEFGSTIHTASIGLASSAIYYLNFGLIVVYVLLFLSGLLLMLFSALVEITIVKAGLLVYFNLLEIYVYGFLAFFVLDLINLFAAINLEVRWINFLNL